MVPNKLIKLPLNALIIMKNWIIILSFSMLALTVNAQQKAQLSANLKLFLNAQSTQTTQVVRYKTATINYLSALIKVNNETVNMASFKKLGVLIGTKAGDIYTVQIPENQLQNFVNLSGILYIQLDEPVATSLESAKRSSRVDSVQLGIDLPMAYTGKNVVVGIIDAGFDYTHPTFYDTLGNQLRIKRVWEQRKNGTPPAMFNYGNEITDTSTMLTIGNDVNSFSHGTHVGGIAAGSGIGSLYNTRGRGVAYQSDLVFVGIKPNKSEWTSAGMSSIIDAVNYIFTYAALVGKPAAANLSWGCSIGPNDGSSLFSQALANLVGPGKIFVVSAGNNGDENIHWSGENTSDSIMSNQTFIQFPNVAGEKRTWVDIWGQTQKPLCVSFMVYNGNSVVDSSATVCVASNQTQNGHLIGFTGDTIFYNIAGTETDINNQKTHLLVDLHSKANDSLSIKVWHGGQFNAWLGYVNDYNGYYGAFVNYNKPWATQGNSSYTLGEMSCSPSAITVAAYVSKISFKNLAGAQQSYLGYASTNKIAPFSSKGPTANNQMKPDIAAPGMTIASSVNSFDVSYSSGGGNYASSVYQYVWPVNNKTYYYAEASGTSMSAPMMSGIVALMLEAHPMLTPNQLKSVLSQTAYKDNFTTNTPDSAIWGYGKANAYAMLKKAVVLSGTKELSSIATSNLIAYPNPNNGSFWVDFDAAKNGNAVVEVSNILGQTLASSLHPITVGNNQININNKNLKAGMYWIKITVSNQQFTTKVIVN